MPRANQTHTDGIHQIIHADDIDSVDAYLAKYSANTVMASEYGAKQDGVTDDTSALQAALTAAAPTAGRVVVTAPTLCAGQLTIPYFVSLETRWPGLPRGPYGQGTTPNVLGPSLLTTGNAGSTSPSLGFLTLQRGASFSGIIAHPNQTQTNPPIAYPPAIVLASGHAGATLHNVLLVNPYIGVWCDNHEKPVIDLVGGQALNTGLYLDRCFDITRVSNIHWWNYWKAYASGDPLETYQRHNLVAFNIGRVDGLHARSWNSFGHYIGVFLTQVANGPASGSIDGIWLDGGGYGVVAAAVAYQGMTIRDSKIYSLFKDGSGAATYPVAITGNATGLDNLTFDGYDFNIDSAQNAGNIFVASGVTGGVYTFTGGKHESYTSSAVINQSTAAKVHVRGAHFRGVGNVMDVSTLSSSATGVQEVSTSEFLTNPSMVLPATLPPGLDIARNRAFAGGEYTPEAFGARRDNSHDDTSALNAAVAAAGLTAGTVRLGRGVYKTTAPLTFTASHVRMVGAGRGATKLNNTSLTTDAIQIGAAGFPSHIFIEDLEISGTLASRTAGNGVTLTNTGTGVTLRSVLIDNHVDGVLFGAGVNEPLLDDVLISSCTGSFLHLEPGTGARPVDVKLRNIFLGSPSGSSAIGIDMASFAGLYASNIDITGAFAYAGRFHQTQIGQSCDWGFWHQVLFDSATNSGLYLDSTPGLSATVVRSQRFVDCWFASCATNGLEINANTTNVRFDGITFTSCRFQHNGHQGSHCYGSLATVFNIRWTDCTWSANGTASSGTYDGALFDGGFSFWSIRGGKAGLEAQGNGTDYTKSQNFGISITASSCGNFDIDGIDCTGNINGAGLFNAASTTSGTWTVKNVRGYNPRGSLGPPTVPAASTDCVNPYGCDLTAYIAGGTGVSVTVNGTATGLAAGPFPWPAMTKINLGAYTVAPTWKVAGN